MISTFRDQTLFTQLRGIDRKVEAILKRLGQHPGLQNLSSSLKRDLKLVLVEAITNAFRHGGAHRKQPVQVKVQANAKSIHLEIQDRGPGFSLKSALKKRPEELSVGGRGLWILKTLMDRVSYQKGKPNRLILERRLTRPKNVEVALELLTRLQVSLQSLKPIQAFYEELLEFLIDFFNAERISLLTLEEESGKLKLAASRGLNKTLQKKIAIRPGEGVAGYVFSTGRSLLIQDARSLKGRGLKSSGKNYRSSSFMSVPVTVNPDRMGEEALGVLNITDPRDGKTFNAQDLKLLQLMVTQAAGLFRVRSLMEQVRRQESWRRELAIVAEIQSRLLPSQFPKIKGIGVAGQYELSPQGGGDYYDVFELEGELWGVIADVSGHNVASALTMSAFRSLARHTLHKAKSPGQWLKLLRQEMQEELEQTMHFISAWTFHLNPKGELVLSGAGHPPVLHYRTQTPSKAKVWQEYKAKHLPLGLSDEMAVQNTRVKLAQGDWIFFYTDGLFDPHMRESGWDYACFQQWFEERVRHKPSPSQVVKNLFEEIKNHRRGLKHPDDVAVLGMRCGVIL